MVSLGNLPGCSCQPSLPEVISFGLVGLLVQTTDRIEMLGACDAEAQAAGYKALVVTVDSPRLGSREADERNKYAAQA